MTVRGRVIFGFAALSGVAMVGILAWEMGDRGTSAVTKPTRSVPEVGGMGKKLPPPVGFDRVLEVFAQGGTSLKFGEAVELLDSMTRSGKALEGSSREELLAAMEHGTPEGMGEGEWSHLFNNACNVMAVGQSTADEKLIALLERIASDDPRLVMKLYALQHLGVSYDRASETSQQRLRLLVRQMLAEPDSQTAGTALVLLRKWEGSTEGDAAATKNLRWTMVTDITRPIDVRVSALHTIADDPGVIELARRIASDPAQPIILRKVAINLIGQHGEASDLPVLRQYGQESPRLAQAGTPAVRMLEERLGGKVQPALVPY
jgi:hypothetical protein